MELLESDSDDSEPESSLVELAAGETDIGRTGSGTTLTAGESLQNEKEVKIVAKLNSILSRSFNFHSTPRITEICSSNSSN